MADLGKTSTGLQPNVAGVLAYLLGIISGIVFLLLEKDNRFVKFHAVQSIGLSLTCVVLGLVVGVLPGIGIALSAIVNLAALALWIICMVKAYQGARFKLPVIGEIASQMAGGSAS